MSFRMNIANWNDPEPEPQNVDETDIEQLANSLRVKQRQRQNHEEAKKRISELQSTINKPFTSISEEIYRKCEEKIKSVCTMLHNCNITLNDEEKNICTFISDKGLCKIVVFGNIESNIVLKIENQTQEFHGQNIIEWSVEIPERKIVKLYAKTTPLIDTTGIVDLRDSVIEGVQITIPSCDYTQ